MASLGLSISYPNGQNSTFIDSVKASVTNQTQALHALIGEGAGAYFNEADPYVIYIPFDVLEVIYTS